MGIELKEGEELFSTYISEMNKLVHELDEDLDGNELNKLSKILHSIKGIAGNFGITDVYEEAIVFEMLLKENKNIDVNFYKGNLISHIEDAEEEIKQFFYDSTTNS